MDNRIDVLKNNLEPDFRGFDLVYAVTQNNINAHLAFLFGKKDGIQKYFSIWVENREVKIHNTNEQSESDPGGIKEGKNHGFWMELKPPTVKLFGSTDQKTNEVDFFINAQSIVTSLPGDDFSDEQVITSTPGKIGYITLSVPLSVKEYARPDMIKNLTEKDAKKLQKIFEEFKRSNLDHLFSIRQLFMDFQAPFLVRNSQAYIPGLSITQTEFVRSEHFLQKMIDKLLEQGSSNILGHVIVSKSNGKLPTFTPTDLSFKKNFYKKDDKQSGVNPASDLNTLNYQVMINGNEPPIESADLYTGNWIVGTEHTAVMAIHRDQFFYGYLIPILQQKINQVFDPDRMRDETHFSDPVWYTKPFVYPDWYHKDYPKQLVDFFSNVKEKQEVTLGSMNFEKEHERRHSGTSKKRQIKFRKDTTVKYIAGTNQITGDYFIRSKAKISLGLAGHTQVITIVQGKYNLAFDVDKEGQIIVNLTLDPKDPQLETHRSGSGGADIKTHRRQLDPILDVTKQSIPNIVRAMTDIETALNGAKQFILPSNQYLSFSDLTFNKEGHLMVNASYKA